MVRKMYLSAMVIAALMSSVAVAGVNGNFSTPDALYSGAMFEHGNGLAVDGTTVYYFDYARVISIDAQTKAVSDLATIGRNAGPAFVEHYNGNIYSSHTTSYASDIAPADSSTGTVDGGSYTEKSTLSGTYDAAITSDGTTYIVANPYPNGATNGTEIFTIDWTTGVTTKVGTIGGPSGGITTDTAGNLYYASFSDSAIYRFDAADLAGGNVTMADATLVVNTNSGPGYLAMGDNGEIFVTEGKSIKTYDLATGNNLATIATVTDEAGAQGAQESIWFGSIAYEDDTLYAVASNFDYSFAPDADPVSTVYSMAVPEPATLSLIAVSALGMLRRRR